MKLLLFMTRGMSLTAWRDNGSLKRELALYAELARRGVSISIISWGRGEDAAVVAAFPWLRVYENRWKLPPDQYERWMPLLHALPLAQAGIIKSNQVSGADCALRCARFWQKPFVARCGYLWSTFCERQQSPELSRVQEIERSVFAGCGAAIVTTAPMKACLTAQYAVPESRITVIPNYVPREYYAAPLPISESHPVVTQVGRLSEQKNLFSLMEACVGLGVTLQLVGDGELKDALQARAAELGLDVVFRGNVPHEALPDILGKSTVCTLVSLYEGHPKALIEAMARGCAVLAARVEGIEPLIRDGENGLLCATDAASIREGLKRLLSDAALRERLGRAARESAMRFSINHIVEQELALYGRMPVPGWCRKWQAALSMPVRLLSAAARKAFASIQSRMRWVETVPLALIRFLIRRKTPADALRYLFGLEDQLYALESAQAIAYDGGVHTKHRHTRYHDFFIERLQPGETVCDIGSGNGFLAYDMAARAGAVVPGIELNSTQVAAARERYAHPRVTFVQGDALKDVPAEMFDTVVLSNVLEHLPERAAFLRSVRMRVHPRRFLLRVPLFERDWRVPLKKELGIEWRLDLTHETEYTEEAFRNELEQAGLHITELHIRWGEIWCEAHADADAGHTL